MAIVAYVGCNANAEHPAGIYVLSVDPQSGILEKTGSRKLFHAVYLANSPDGRHVYSCSDTGSGGFSPLCTLGGFYRPLAVLPQKEVTP